MDQQQQYYRELVRNRNLSPSPNPADSEEAPSQDLKSSIYFRSSGKHMFMAQSDCLQIKPQKATLKKKHFFHKYLQFTSWNYQRIFGLFFACTQQKRTKKKNKTNLPSIHFPKESFIQGQGTKEARTIAQLGVGLIRVFCPSQEERKQGSVLTLAFIYQKHACKWHCIPANDSFKNKMYQSK